MLGYSLRALRRNWRGGELKVLAAALVMTCGIGTFVATQSTYHSLVVARATYSDNYRFADVFAGVKRAPNALAASAFGLGRLRSLYGPSASGATAPKRFTRPCRRSPT